MAGLNDFLNAYDHATDREKPVQRVKHGGESQSVRLPPCTVNDWGLFGRRSDFSNVGGSNQRAGTPSCRTPHNLKQRFETSLERPTFAFATAGHGRSAAPHGHEDVPTRSSEKDVTIPHSKPVAGPRDRRASHQRSLQVVVLGSATADVHLVPGAAPISSWRSRGCPSSPGRYVRSSHSTNLRTDSPR